MSEIDAIRAAVLNGAPGDELAALPLPEAVRGALVKADEQEMFNGLPSEDKDPRKSIHVEDFPLPEAPTTARKRLASGELPCVRARTRSINLSLSASRPTKRSASASSK